MANDLIYKFRANCNGVVKDVPLCYNHLGNKPLIKGTGAPTPATEGTIGLLYQDTIKGGLYKCTAITPNTETNTTSYTWEEFITTNEAATKTDIQEVEDEIQTIEDDMLLMRIAIDDVDITASEALSIAEGANKAIGVESYEELVNLLKRTPDFVVGQNFYIKTLNVPDMWLYSIEDNGVEYTYVDDASIIAATTEAPLQIGTYKIAQLETLKTDLTNYVKNTDVSKNGKPGLMALYGDTNGWGYGLYNDGGKIYLAPAGYAQLNTRTPESNPSSALSGQNKFRPITNATIDYAVKKVLTEDKLANTDYAWTNEEKALARTLLDITNAVYPVGSIYMSVNNVSPATLFGGSWEQLKDRFLLGAGDQFEGGATGGSADAVVVEHTHSFEGVGGDWDGINNWGLFRSGSTSYNNPSINHGSYDTSSGYVAIKEAGEDGTGKNMPPYLAVYMWKRVG